MKEEQDRIVAAVEARGYREGWDDRTYLVRQVAKAVEEVAEMAQHVGAAGQVTHSTLWYINLRVAGGLARQHFDLSKKNGWENVMIDSGQLATEVVDLQVVLCNIADVLGIDLMAEAVKKATSDIDRGVR